MRLSFIGLAYVAGVAVAQAPDLSGEASMFPVGPDADSPLLNITTAPGPYQVTIREDPQFPDRTIYVPQKIGLSNQTVPILAWENGICYKYGRMYAAFLTEIASNGYLVVTPGPPNQKLQGMTNRTWQLDSIKYASNWKNAPFKVDSTKVAIGGHSCGGGESLSNLALDTNKKITTALIYNMAGSDSTFEKVNVPLLLVHGGEEDLAYPAEDNFAYLVENKPELPVFKAVLETGHLGSFWSRPRGGIYAETAVKWLDWQLKGKTAAGDWFKGGDESLAAQRGWNVESSSIDEIGVSRRHKKAKKPTTKHN